MNVEVLYCTEIKNTRVTVMMVADSAVSQVATSCAGSVNCTQDPPLSTVEGDCSVESADCGTMKIVFQQVAGGSLLVENVTDPNRHPSKPNNDVILQKVAIYRALEN
jgi:hypothetical protein